MFDYEVKNGIEVVRSKGGSSVGNIGKIISVDLVVKRAKVDWNDGNTTWVSFGVIEPKNIPYRLTRETVKKGWRKGREGNYKYERI